MTHTLPMRIWLMLLLCILGLLLRAGPSQGATKDITKIVITKAQGYLDVRETYNNNREPEIDTWLKFAGVGLGNPYCQAFANYCYYLAYQEVNQKFLLSKNPRCATWLQWAMKNPLLVKVIPASKVALGYPVPPGAVISWKHGRASPTEDYNHNGHAGILIKQRSDGKLDTIEGNTKPSDAGDQTGRTIGDLRYGHDGVYQKVRTLGSGGNFPILAFVVPYKTKFEVP